MNWALFALKIPALIQGTMRIVEAVRGAKGPEKRQAVLDHVDDTLQLVEFAAGRDVFNEPAIFALREVYLQAEAQVLNARRIADQAKAALQQGLLAKGTVTPADSSTPPGAGTP